MRDKPNPHLESRPEPEQLISLGELAKWVPVGIGKIRQLVHTDQLGHSIIGARYFTTLKSWEEYVEYNMRRPRWDGETKDQDCVGLKNEEAITSYGHKEVGVASARRAQQISKKLKFSSRTGAQKDKGGPARVTQLRSS